MVLLNLNSGMNSLGKKTITQQSLHQKMLKAGAIIDQEYHLDITISALAKKVQLSEFHFARCFREVFSVSPYQYYLNKKIARSAEMLLSSVMDVSQISLELGFSEVSSFSKSFKRRFGVSPVLFRKTMGRS